MITAQHGKCVGASRGGRNGRGRRVVVHKGAPKEMRRWHPWGSGEEALGNCFQRQAASCIHASMPKQWYNYLNAKTWKRWESMDLKWRWAGVTGERWGEAFQGEGIAVWKPMSSITRLLWETLFGQAEMIEVCEGPIGKWTKRDQQRTGIEGVLVWGAKRKNVNFFQKCTGKA